MSQHFISQKAESTANCSENISSKTKERETTKVAGKQHIRRKSMKRNKIVHRER